MLKRDLLQKNLRKKLSTEEEKKKSIATSPIDFASQARSVQRKQKRKDFMTIDESGDLKKKRTGDDLNTLDQRAESKDQITQLPEHIIHYILSLLRSTKEAARTSILSKRWRQTWNSFPILTFDQHKIQEQERGCKDMKNEKQISEDLVNKKKIFKDFVDNSLKNHLERTSSIHKLVLHVNSYDLELASHMDRWIGVAIENNMKELDLHVVVKKSRHYSLPQTVFAAKTLTGLRLHGCWLKIDSDIKLPHLRKLYLRNLRVDQQLIHNLISSCLLIEDLRFVNCTGLKNLQISSVLKLERVEVHHCHGLKTIDLKAPNLQTFWYCGKKSLPCKIDLAACVSLKRLTLEDGNMTDELFQDRFASLPVLEKLDLSKCNKLKNIIITSMRLKSLVLRGCKKLMEVDIDAPNLFSFEYKGDNMPFSFTHPLRLRDVKLSFESQNTRQDFHLGDDDTLWFARLREFLGKFDHSDGLKLVIRSKKNVIIHEELKEILLPPLHDLKLEIIKPSTGFQDLLDNLLRTWHPKTLSIVSSSSSKFPKLVNEKMLNREKDPRCCLYNTPNNKCWLHYLKDVKFENFEVAEEKRTRDWIAWLKSSPTVLNQTTSFRLYWESD